MKKSLELLKQGFESSSGTTPEFNEFFKVFKKEFTRELKSVSCTNIKFSKGHFYISGFFTTNDNVPFYFSLSDVRGMDYCLKNNPDSCMCKLLYRKVKDYNDYTGGINRYATIQFGMADDMCRYFNL